MLSWNVNGLRACMGKGFMDFFRECDADIFGIQEIKMLREQGNFDFSGYREYWYSAVKRGYSGTAVFTKREPLSVVYGIPGHEDEGRVITLEFDEFYHLTVYTPNAQDGLKRLDYRMAWEDDFRAFVCSLDAAKPVVICGDLNVAHKEIDLKNWKTNSGSPGFSPQERGKMTELLEAGFVDTFRHLYPDLEGAYSWWSYRGGARERNAGWRIDYFVVSEALRKGIAEARIYNEVMGSDHCPVGLVLEV